MLSVQSSASYKLPLCKNTCLTMYCYDQIPLSVHLATQIASQSRCPLLGVFLDDIDKWVKVIDLHINDFFFTFSRFPF